jgi:hypothetical protein
MRATGRGRSADAFSAAKIIGFCVFEQFLGCFEEFFDLLVCHRYCLLLLI